MDSHLNLGIIITVGIAMAGGLWALVHLVAKLAAEAATIKTQLAMALPVVQEMPQVKQTVAVHGQRLDDHDDDLRELRPALVKRH